MSFKQLFSIDNNWFFTDLPSFFKAFLFFVRGDLLVLLPFLLVIFLIGFFSVKFMFVMLGVYIAVRYLGEMIYWFLQQFYDRKYRPYDFGFKNLDNHAIYILYQTFAIVGTSVGVGIVLYQLFFAY
jgi:hypothetical protein